MRCHFYDWARQDCDFCFASSRLPLLALIRQVYVVLGRPTWEELREYPLAKSHVETEALSSTLEDLNPANSHVSLGGAPSPLDPSNKTSTLADTFTVPYKRPYSKRLS